MWLRMAGAAVEVVAGLRMIFWWWKPTIDRQSAINRQEGELMNISTADLSDEFGDALS